VTTQPQTRTAIRTRPIVSILGSVAALAVVVAAVAYFRDGSSESEAVTNDTLTPWYAGSAAPSDFQVLEEALRQHEAEMEAQFGPLIRDVTPYAEVEAALRQHENAIASEFGPAPTVEEDRAPLTPTMEEIAAEAFAEHEAFYTGTQGP
jgi:hypothetical protein